MKRAVLLFLISIICVVTGCQQDDNHGPDYYMSATINNHAWKADERYAWAQLEYNHHSQQHDIVLFSQAVKPLEDGIRYQIGISINHLPAKGKYYFNNSGVVMSNTNSAAGIINGWTNDRADDQFLCFSVDGYVEITEISKEFIRGHFEYNAVRIQGVELIDTVRVNKGEFFVPSMLCPVRLGMGLSNVA